MVLVARGVAGQVNQGDACGGHLVVVGIGLGVFAHMGAFEHHRTQAKGQQAAVDFKAVGTGFHQEDVVMGKFLGGPVQWRLFCRGFECVFHGRSPRVLLRVEATGAGSRWFGPTDGRLQSGIRGLAPHDGAFRQGSITEKEQLAQRFHRTFWTFGHLCVLQALTGSAKDVERNLAVCPAPVVA